MHTRHHTPPAAQPAAHCAEPLATRSPDAGVDMDTDDTAPACGWFESSHVLRQGLVVSELPDSDGSVAALWFAQLASARLQ